MPVIQVKTTLELTEKQKNDLVKELTDAFREGSELKRVADNIEYIVEDNVWISFRGDARTPAAYIGIYPGYLTKESDYAPIMEGFFKVLNRLGIDNYHAYINVAQMDYWGYEGKRVV